MSKSSSTLPTPSFDDPKHDLRIYRGDCLEILSSIPENSVDLVFADPLYFLSNGGITSPRRLGRLQHFVGQDSRACPHLGCK